MQREIKFRGKRVDNGEWVFGSYFKDCDDSSFIIPSGMGIFAGQKVIPETVGQFTALKDKNEKEIYEGDILKTTYKYHNQTEKEDIALVEYDELNPCFVMSYKYMGAGHICHEYDFIQVGLRTNEIIGNIHDNPELLK